MTTTEFKEAHPELAHLEGPALWNAMEDSMLAKSRVAIDGFGPRFRIMIDEGELVSDPDGLENYMKEAFGISDKDPHPEEAPEMIILMPKGKRSETPPPIDFFYEPGRAT